MKPAAYNAITQRHLASITDVKKSARNLSLFRGTLLCRRFTLPFLYNKRFALDCECLRSLGDKSVEMGLEVMCITPVSVFLLDIFLRWHCRVNARRWRCSLCKLLQSACCLCTSNVLYKSIKTKSFANISVILYILKNSGYLMNNVTRLEPVLSTVFDLNNNNIFVFFNQGNSYPRPLPFPPIRY